MTAAFHHIAAPPWQNQPKLKDTVVRGLIVSVLIFEHDSIIFVSVMNFFYYLSNVSKILFCNCIFDAPIRTPNSMLILPPLHLTSSQSNFNNTLWSFYSTINNYEEEDKTTTQQWQCQQRWHNTTMTTNNSDDEYNNNSNAHATTWRWQKWWQ